MTAMPGHTVWDTEREFYLVTDVKSKYQCQETSGWICAMPFCPVIIDISYEFWVEDHHLKTMTGHLWNMLFKYHVLSLQYQDFNQIILVNHANENKSTLVIWLIGWFDEEVCVIHLVLICFDCRWHCGVCSVTEYETDINKQKLCLNLIVWCF